MFLSNKKHVAGICTLGVRNGSKNMSTWLNTLKYNLSDTIKKWYLFSDLGVVYTTIKTEKAVFITAFSVLKNEVSGLEHAKERV